MRTWGMPVASTGSILDLKNEKDASLGEAIVTLRSQTKRDRRLAEKVLSWIVCAKEPLSITSLQMALAIENGMTETKHNHRIHARNITDVCSGLVVIEDSTGFVRFRDPVCKEFFEHYKVQVLPDAETLIASVCVRKMLLPLHEQPELEFTSDLTTLELFEIDPLYKYAATSWADHSRVSPAMSDMVLQILEKQINGIDAFEPLWISGALKCPLWARKDNAMPYGVTGLHLAAYYGLTDAMSRLLNKDVISKLPRRNQSASANHFAPRFIDFFGELDLQFSKPRQRHRQPWMDTAAVLHIFQRPASDGGFTPI